MKKLVIFGLVGIFLMSSAGCAFKNPNVDLLPPTESSNEEDTGMHTPITEESAISAVSPTDRSSITLANARISAWSSSYDYRKTNSLEHCLGEDLYFPEPVTFEWTCNKNADYYHVYISKNSDLADHDSYLVNSTHLTLSTLCTGTEYYWKVFAFSGADVVSESATFTFKTEKHPRCISIDGVSNTRDIGGIACDDGMQIKQGLVYRGARLNYITDAGRDVFMNELCIKTDLDLRSSGEAGGATHSPVDDSLNYYQISGRYYNSDETGIFSDEGKAAMAEEIKVFADINNYPIYFHCQVGRDRTGTLALILEGLLGASANDIIRDYELSYFSQIGSPSNSDELNALRTQIINTYNHILMKYPGMTFAQKVENYLIGAGVTKEEIQTIRDIMLEEVK